MEISSLSPTLSLLSFGKKASISTSSKSSFSPPNHTSTAFNGGRRLALARSWPGVLARKKKFVCTSLFGLGLPELAVIAGVAALVFGPKQIPEIGRSIGKTVRGFQQAAKEFEAEIKKPDEPGSANESIEAESVSGSSEQKENAGVSRSKESS